MTYAVAFGTVRYASATLNVHLQDDAGQSRWHELSPVDQALHFFLQKSRYAASSSAEPHIGHVQGAGINRVFRDNTLRPSQSGQCSLLYRYSLLEGVPVADAPPSAVVENEALGGWHACVSTLQIDAAVMHDHCRSIPVHPAPVERQTRSRPACVPSSQYQRASLATQLLLSCASCDA